MSRRPPQPEFWEASFQDKQTMWGFEPARSALLARDVFVRLGVRQVLVPGIGYGRNAQAFRAAGMRVTGIEIAQTAIDLARQHYGPDLVIYHGSVAAMPFDAQRYDGIFCYDLVHLLSRPARRKLIADCYRQLAPGGCMLFTAITTQAPTYGRGRRLSPDRYEIMRGVRLFFYDRESVTREFGRFGLVEVVEVEENFPFFLIQCRKPAA
ncbi:class I SAM-dependent methyltransferase [Hymenobacter sp. B81]|uniref:class I SAM-dependent methyltransferase n=1 Tax=Hymenobacter sp. B81 TaxID=3344878 RepID=UPI0037DD29C0